MLTSTFIHAQGIGTTTEKKIWKSGATDWQTFLADPAVCGLSSRQLTMLVPVVEKSVTSFASEDFRYFSHNLAHGEHWRAYGELGDRAAYVDIETTGMSMGAGITVIGLYNGRETKSYIKGFNLEEFVDDVEQYPLLVTYAGAMFDLPHLRYAFPGHPLDQVHVDLCPTLRRIGYKGGLKHIEDVLGISRSDEVQGLSGWDAVRLWREWEYGSKEALDVLVEYNRADVENLKPLAEFAYAQLRSRTLDLL